MRRRLYLGRTLFNQTTLNGMPLLRNISGGLPGSPWGSAQLASGYFRALLLRPLYLNYTTGNMTDGELSIVSLARIFNARE
jgi:hypothetical protein